LPQKNSFLGYPVLFHLPETRWGIGAAASYQFHIDRSDTVSPGSQVQFGLAYTQNKQFLVYLPYNLWWSQRKNNLSGELGFYDYSYPFFGVGFDQKGDLDEQYEVSFPRLRANFLRLITNGWYLGGRWWYEDYRITKREEDGKLIRNNVPGAAGNKTSGPGLVVVYDNRDGVFETRKGYYLELVWHHQSRLTASEYYYERFRFDFRKFFPLGLKNSLGVQAFGDFLTGAVPFSQMASIGGSKRMRGFYEGHFRDKNMLMIQTEARIKVYRKWGLTVFAQSGVLANDRLKFALPYSHSAAGAGIRYMFDAKRRVNVRLDYAISKEAQLMYFTIGEAF
jgi:outer membrane protein assembly factor BamA